MELTPVTDSKQLEMCSDSLFRTLVTGTKKFAGSVGFQGGSIECDFHYLSSCDVWYVTRRLENRWWNCFGFGRPSAHEQIVVEINPPTKGINKRCAGIFLQDPTKRFYLAHSGKVGGGRTGVGKTGFYDAYIGEWQQVRFPDGSTGEYVVLGALNSPRLGVSIKDFMLQVQQYKSGSFRQSAPKSGRSFNPEFFGTRKRYTISDEVEAKCTHGVVINTLKAEVDRKVKPDAIFNDKRDLVVEKNGTLLLFEAKTLANTSSLYQAVGQLMMHAHSNSPRSKMIVVLPEQPTVATRKVLRILGIEVLCYEFTQAGIDFPGLDDLMAKMF